jgi:hypothetical protein
VSVDYLMASREFPTRLTESIVCPSPARNIPLFCCRVVELLTGWRACLGRQRVRLQPGFPHGDR